MARVRSTSRSGLKEAQATPTDVTERLRRAYDAGAAGRDETSAPDWKRRLRDEFRDRILDEGARTLVEFGAGVGHDSLSFEQAGLDVLAFDLSPEMVRRCRQKGINAKIADVRTFDTRIAMTDAIWTMNCLLHVPNSELPDVLTRFCSVLRPGGLFFCGTWGGDDEEGVLANDSHDPPRFFSLRSAATLRAMLERDFVVIVDHQRTVPPDQRSTMDAWPFHGFTVRRPG